MYYVVLTGVTKLDLVMVGFMLVIICMIKKAVNCGSDKQTQNKMVKRHC